MLWGRCCGQPWGPPCAVSGDSPEDILSAVVVGMGMALGTPLCKCSGPGDIHGDPAQLVLGIALGPLTVLWLRRGCGPGDSSRTAMGIPSAQEFPWGLCLQRCRAGGALLGTPQVHTTAVDVGLKDGSLWTSCLKCGAGDNPTDSPHQRNTPGPLMNAGTGVWGQGHPASPLPEMDTLGSVLGDPLC